MQYNKHFLQDKKTELNKETVDQLICHALVEDIGKGDITTQLTIPEDKNIRAHIIAKEDCVVCGIDIAARTFELIDKNIDFKAFCREGQKIQKNKIIAVLSGRASLDYLDAATGMIKNGCIDCLVTCPISKEANRVGRMRFYRPY